MPASWSFANRRWHKNPSKEVTSAHLSFFRHWDSLRQQRAQQSIFWNKWNWRQLEVQNVHSSNAHKQVKEEGKKKPHERREMEPTTGVKRWCGLPLRMPLICSEKTINPNAISTVFFIFLDFELASIECTIKNKNKNPGHRPRKKPHTRCCHLNQFPRFCPIPLFYNVLNMFES